MVSTFYISSIFSRGQRTLLFISSPIHAVQLEGLAVPKVVNLSKNGTQIIQKLESAGLVDCLNPAFDTLESDLVTLFVSNTSCIIPSHVNRLKEDYYHAQDIADY